MSRGVIASQKIWVTFDGVTRTATISELQAAKANGTLHRYRVYVMEPEAYTTSLQGIGDILEGGDPEHTATLTTEDGGTVTLGVTGAVLDITEWDPVHLTVNFPTNVKYAVAASNGSERPGNKRHVRKVTGYKIGGTAQTFILPVSNFISDSMFVIIC